MDIDRESQARRSDADPAVGRASSPSNWSYGEAVPAGTAEGAEDRARHGAQRREAHLAIALQYDNVGMRWDPDRGDNLLIFEKVLSS